jgi:predicted RNA-binding Zn ribbon-like protein
MQHLPALFIGDAQALDFLNSVATPIDVPVDWLDDGEGLLSWLRQAQLVPEPVLEHMRAQHAGQELEKVAEQARSLREWFRGFVREHKGRPLNRHDLRKLEPLNRLLERDDSFVQLAPAPSEPPLELRTMRRWRSPDALLTPIAEALARFVCSENFTHVKACEGATCTLLFADHTRSGVRRWCSMAICGNRAKQAAHRQRLKQLHLKPSAASRPRSLKRR